VAPGLVCQRVPMRGGLARPGERDDRMQPVRGDFAKHEGCPASAHEGFEAAAGTFAEALRAFL
jgi:hypothetical protein